MIVVVYIAIDGKRGDRNTPPSIGSIGNSNGSDLNGTCGGGSGGDCGFGRRRRLTANGLFISISMQ
jgi:hypothetical protein